MRVEHLNPYPTLEPKRDQIARAFNRLAPRYDRMNRLLSFGLDTGWRRRALRHLLDPAPARILDLATGTADFALLAARLLPNARITGIDLSEAMLAEGRRKISAAGVEDRVALLAADGLALPFPAGAFDAVTVAFGIRNFENIATGLSEMRRALAPGGRLVMLELYEPRRAPIRQLYRFYARYAIPLMGGLFVGRRPEYDYLQASIACLSEDDALPLLLRQAGFRDILIEAYAWGVCCCFVARKAPLIPEPRPAEPRGLGSTQTALAGFRAAAR